MIGRPFLRYSYGRDAFVLRLVGSEWGPVLRVERRSREARRTERVERRAHPA